MLTLECRLSLRHLGSTANILIIYIHLFSKRKKGCGETLLHRDNTDHAFIAICAQRAFPRDVNAVIPACFTTGCVSSMTGWGADRHLEKRSALYLFIFP